MVKKVLCIILLLSLLTPQVNAQYGSKLKKQRYRFNAGLMAGVSFSQLDGDNYSGFDKRGLRTGVRGSIFVTERLDVTLGFLLNQGGSRFDIQSNYADFGTRARKIHFDYMETPLLLTIKEGKFNGKGFILDLGFSYAKLVNSKVEEDKPVPNNAVSFESLEPRFKSDALFFVIAGNYFFNKHLGLGLNYNYQLNKAYTNLINDDISGPRTVSNINGLTQRETISLLRNYQVSIQLIYQVF